MAAELPRPGVEVVQEFAAVSPTIVTPTLVPCNVGPFFEVIEVLNSDGTTNDDARLSDTYEQLELNIAQSSFPSPRENIDEVDVLEETIRVFFDFGGTLTELSKDSAFLTKFNDPDPTSQPFVVGTTVEPGTGYDVDGRTLILLMDSHTSLSDSEFVSGANLPTADNVIITFAATVAGGTLTLQEVIDQINTLLPGVASNDGTDKLKLSSSRYGAGASVVVRPQGTAIAGTDRLGFDPSEETIAVGSGFFADDDSDGDQLSPRLKIYAGSEQVLQSAFPGSPQTALTAPFLDANIEAGDTVIADGTSIGDVAQVESDILTMEVEQRIISNDNKFAPRRVWVKANNLVFPAPAASSAGSVTGTIQTAAATPGFIVSPNPSMQSAVGAAESFDVNVVDSGVALPTETISTGAGWADLAAAVAGINATPNINFEAYFANESGEEVSTAYEAANPTITHLGLRTLATNAGSGAALTLVSSTITTDLGFTTLPVGDVGENIRYRPGTPALATEGTAWGAVVATETITYTPEVLGVPKAAETITWSLSHPATPAGLTAAVADWNDQARHSEAYESNSSGVEQVPGSAAATHFSIRSRGENVGVSAELDVTATDSGTTIPVATYNGTDTDLDSQNFQWSLDNNPKVYDVIFVADEDDGGTSLQQVLDKINAETPNIAAADSSSPPLLELTSNKVGEASEMEIGSGTANPNLGFSTGSTVGNGRPAPDLAVAVSGDVVIQSQLLFDGLTAEPFSTGFSPMLLAYKGLRIDLSPEADNPALLVVDDIDTLEAAADPISTDNPGSLMMFLSLINAPSVSIAGIGVPEVSADAPNGTPLGYAKCAEFLENEEVYAISTGSQIGTVHQTFLTHVNVMSEPEQKGERIYFFNPVIPDRANPDIVGSGTDANSTATTNELTIEVNIAPALIAAGLDPNTDLNPTTGPIEEQIYLDLGSDDKQYLLQKVTGGTTLTLRTTFASTDGNDDAFYSSTTLPTGIISDDWSVFIRGDQLLIPGTTKPDKNAIAETIQEVGLAFGFRRGFMVHPDQVGINVTGLEQVVEGFYGASCVVGMVGEQPPQQGFTNFPITGLTRVVGSSDFFTNTQLNVIAAGGVYILIQDAQGAPVIARHQLSTDLTSIETRELSITKVVDYTAKFLRAGLRNFIGRSNITQPFLDNLSTVIQGQLNFLVENAVLIGADINNIIQDADSPDTILVDVTLDVPFPANFIRLTLII
jgi:hypothetical protein